MDLNNFFEKQVSLLKRFCGNYEMYNSVHSTKTDDSIQTECWYESGITKVWLVNVAKSKVELIRSYKESESSFFSKLL